VWLSNPIVANAAGGAACTYREPFSFVNWLYYIPCLCDPCSAPFIFRPCCAPARSFAATALHACCKPVLVLAESPSNACWQQVSLSTSGRRRASRLNRRQGYTILPRDVQGFMWPCALQADVPRMPVLPKPNACNTLLQANQF
jgi:hypothetical protein